MKNDFNHIDEVFKNTFENFEADVDPSVWSNVQQNISSSGSSVNNPSSSTTGSTTGIAKSVILKAAAGVIATAGIVGSIYVYNNSNQEQANQTPQEIVNDVTEITSVENTIKDHQLNNKTHSEKELEINNEPNKLIEENETVNELITTSPSSDVTTGSNIIEQEIETVENTSDVADNSNTTTNSSTTPVVKSKQPVNTQESKQAQTAELNVRIKSNVKKGKAPLYVEFNTIGKAVSYLWDFGDGNISSEETPYHTFKEPGRYKVSLTVIDEDANQKTITEYIEVEKNNTSKLEKVQNVFSPNGDGLNDIIKIEGENIAKFSASVMDSKGNLIYQWTSIDGFWDGKDNNNNILPKGTYYLIVEAIGEDGEKHLEKKSIQLY